MSAHGRPSPSASFRIGTPEQFRWLEGVVKVTLVLNLLDALFTLVWVWLGLATEANPLLAELVAGRPVLFVGSKLALVGLGSLLLWRARHRPAAVIGIFVAFLVYYGVLLIHVDYLGSILGTLLSP